MEHVRDVKGAASSGLRNEQAERRDSSPYFPSILPCTTDRFNIDI